ncbi:MAG TPA: hypothetical protein VK194_01660 [Candidatus Deferrimicrobium sp.]|nr:hypothetical protein [Candidatus Deferrimicrobium sp.]
MTYYDTRMRVGFMSSERGIVAETFAEIVRVAEVSAAVRLRAGHVLPALG